MIAEGDFQRWLLLKVSPSFKKRILEFQLWDGNSQRSPFIWLNFWWVGGSDEIWFWFEPCMVYSWNLWRRSRTGRWVRSYLLNLRMVSFMCSVEQIVYTYNLRSKITVNFWFIALDFSSENRFRGWYSCEALELEIPIHLLQGLDLIPSNGARESVVTCVFRCFFKMFHLKMY